MALHGALHFLAQGGRRDRPVGVAQAIETIECGVAGVDRKRALLLAGCENLGAATGSGAAVNHEVEQPLGTSAVGVVHRRAWTPPGPHSDGQATKYVTSVEQLIVRSVSC